MGKKMVDRGNFWGDRRGTGTQPGGTGRGWGLTQWVRGGDGDRDNGYGWGWGQILVPVQLSTIHVCSVVKTQCIRLQPVKVCHACSPT